MREFLAGRAARDAEVAKSIWNCAEVGYQETKSSALLQQGADEGRVQGRGRRRRDPDGLRRDRRQRQAGDRHARRVRRAAGHQPGRRRRPPPIAGKNCRPRLRPSPVRRRLGLGRHRDRGLAEDERHARARSASTARPRRKAAPARSTWCALASSTTSTPCCTGIPSRRELRRASTRRWPTSPRSSASTASRPTPPARPTRAARRSTASRR